MKALVLILFVVLAACDGPGPVYRFFRDMDRESNTRRVFGGSLTFLSDFPPACVLLDQQYTAKCSGALVSKNWVLTAGHCLKSDLMYVKYNTRTLDHRGDIASIISLYRHPDFKVVQEDEGRGMDVTQLYHDIGLARTREAMVLNHQLRTSPIAAMKKLSPDKLMNAEVKVLGFGRTETIENSQGEELFSVKLILQSCERATWFNCFCGTTGSGGRAGGVCTGDSGGPVIYNGTQIGITSMGPVECMTLRNPSPRATSVFTSVFNYLDMLNQTIENPGSTRMILIPLSSMKHKALGYVVVGMLLLLMFIE